MAVRLAFHFKKEFFVDPNKTLYDLNESLKYIQECPNNSWKYKAPWKIQENNLPESNKAKSM